MCAKRLGMAYETSVLQAGEDIDKEMQDSMRVHSTLSLRSAGGLLSRIVPPYSEGGDNVAEWSTERKLEVAAFDSMAIGLSCLVLLVAIVLFSLHALFLRIGGRHPFLFILPKTAYAALLLKGILLPALIYIVALFFIAGNDAPGFRPIHVAPCVFLCVVWPLGYAAYCRYLMARWMHSIGAGNHNAFQASRSLNMACLLVVLLLSIGGVLRPISSWRQRRYAQETAWRHTRSGSSANGRNAFIIFVEVKTTPCITSSCILKTVTGAGCQRAIPGFLRVYGKRPACPLRPSHFRG